MTNQRTLPRVTRPTRIKNQSATLIDHIFTQDNPIIDTELKGGGLGHKPQLETDSY